MNNEKLFLRFITYSPLIFIPLFVILISIVIASSYDDSFQKNLEAVKANTFEVEKKALKTKVQNVSEIITYRQSEIKNELKERVRSRVLIAYDIADSIYSKNVGIKSAKEIKEMIRTALSALIWNGGESFIWILDYNGVFHLAPEYLRNLEGSSILNFQDATGRYVIQEEIKICKTKQEGFLWDTFTKPNTDMSKQYEQVAYVKAFKHYNWYFGSSEYLDTATKNANQELMQTIKNIDLVDNHYFFLISSKGTILINKSVPQYVGKNEKEIVDPKVKLFDTRIKRGLKDKESAFIRYKWINPTSKKLEDKLSYVQRVSNSDWIVGSGFYFSDIDKQINKKKLDLYDAMYVESNKMIYLLLIVILLSVLVSYIISAKLKKSFLAYHKAIEKRSKELEELNATLELKVAQRTQKLQEIAIKDELTDLYNRKYYNETIKDHLSLHKRYSTQFCIMMYDIDDFKSINDLYGHIVGDEVLVKLSELVKSLIREEDLLFRVGGEEFMIIVPNTNIDNAFAMAEKIRTSVAQIGVLENKMVTISIGVTEVEPRDTQDSIFKRVDDLLYKSKREGKNRVSK